MSTLTRRSAVVLLVVLAALFFLSKDPFFLVVFAIVGVGVAFTGYNYLRESRPAS